jgi:phosphoglycerate dehydrogenase-like enzyme
MEGVAFAMVIPTTETGELRVCPVPDYPRWREAIARADARVAPIEDANVLVWGGAHFSELAPLLRPNVRWVQLGWSGIDGLVAAGLLDDARLWSTARGLFGVPVAEHAVMLMLAAAKCLPRYARATTWLGAGGDLVAGKRALIVGAGDIAQALAMRLAAMDMHVTVLARTPRTIAGADEVRLMEELHALLPTEHFVFIAVALAPETRGVIGRRELELMRPDAWLVNVGRGAHVDTGALVEALDDRAIAGAALDVIDPEPLPDGHPLWGMDNVLLTPHTAVSSLATETLVARRLEENLRRYRDGRPLIGAIDAG